MTDTEPPAAPRRVLVELAGQQGVNLSIQQYSSHPQPCLVARIEEPAGTTARSWCDDEPYQWLAVADLLGESFVAVQFAAGIEIVSMVTEEGRALSYAESVGPEWGVAYAPTAALEAIQIELRLSDGQSADVVVTTSGQPVTGP